MFGCCSRVCSFFFSFAAPVVKEKSLPRGQYRVTSFSFLPSHVAKKEVTVQPMVDAVVHNKSLDPVLAAELMAMPEKQRKECIEDLQKIRNILLEAIKNVKFD